MTKILSLVLASCLVTSAIVNAQNKEYSGVRYTSKTYPNVSYNEIFLSHPCLDSIVLEFDQKKPVFMKWYSSKDSKKKRSVEYFDLTFEGDQYVLERDYAIKNIPSFSNDQITYMYSLQQSEKYFRLNAILYKDSITYRFLPPPFHHASYSGDIGQLGELLAKQYGKDNFGAVGDSLLIFQGIVNRGGSLDNVDLIIGSQSHFSDFVKDYLKNQEKSWYPMTKDGRPLRSLIDICINLKADSGVVVSATGRGRKLRIEDFNKEERIFY